MGNWGSLLALIIAAGSAYTEAPVRDAGTIAGRITYLGRPPHRKAFTVTKDPAVCGEQRTGDTWVLSDTGGVANVVVYLPDVASGKKMEGATPVLDQVGCRYQPHVQVAAIGSTLLVRSSDPVLHNVHSFYNGASFINFSMPPATRPLSKRLDKAGGMQLKCDVHSFMRGAIFVANNPYYAITDADGSFAIDGVPPGRHRIATWHEEAGPVFDEIDVPPRGRATWSARIR
jgi:hypothetical protein